MRNPTWPRSAPQQRAAYHVGIHGCTHEAIAVNCRRVPSNAVDCRRMLSIAVDCRRMLSIAVECGRMLSIAVDCRRVPSIAVECHRLRSKATSTTSTIGPSGACCRHKKAPEAYLPQGLVTGYYLAATMLGSGRLYLRMLQLPPRDVVGDSPKTPALVAMFFTQPTWPSM